MCGNILELFELFLEIRSIRSYVDKIIILFLCCQS